MTRDGWTTVGGFVGMITGFVTIAGLMLALMGQVGDLAVQVGRLDAGMVSGFNSVNARIDKIEGQLIGIDDRLRAVEIRLGPAPAD